MPSKSDHTVEQYKAFIEESIREGFLIEDTQGVPITVAEGPVPMSVRVRDTTNQLPLSEQLSIEDARKYIRAGRAKK